MPDQPDRPTKDHPDVRVPPPLLYFSVLGIGLLLQQAAPLPVIPPSAGHPLAIAAAAGWAGLMIWGVSSFRRARTSLVPVRPATALITTYRDSGRPSRRDPKRMVLIEPEDLPGLLTKVAELVSERATRRVERGLRHYGT